MRLQLFQSRENAPELINLVVAAYILMLPCTAAAESYSWGALLSHLPRVGGASAACTTLLSVSLPIFIPVAVYLAALCPVVRCSAQHAVHVCQSVCLLLLFSNPYSTSLPLPLPLIFH
jgi:hypothetical protein